MAESKSKNTMVNGTAKLVKHQKFANLFNCIKEAAAEIKDFSTLDELFVENRRLRDALIAEKDRVEEAEEKNRQILLDLDSTRSETATLFAELAKNYEKQNQEFNRADAARSADLSSRDEQIKSLKSQNEGTRRQIDQYQATILKLREDLGENILTPLEDGSQQDLENRLSALAKEGQNLIARYISTDNNATYDKTNLDGLKKIYSDLPLPLRPSREGLLMRRAAAEALLARNLAQHVFRPFYFTLDNRRSQSGLQENSELFFKLFSGDQRQCTIYRSLVLKYLQDQRSDEDAEEEAAHAAAKSLSSELAGHISSTSDLHKFRADVISFFETAVQIWSDHVQTCSNLIFAELPTTDLGTLSERAEFGTRSAAANPVGARRAVALPLFPYVYAIKENGNQITLHPGDVLWEDQPSVLIAREQAAAESPGNNPGIPVRHASSARRASGVTGSSRQAAVSAVGRTRAA